MFLSLGINCPSVAGSLWDEATEFLLFFSEISVTATVWVVSKSYIFDRRERITSYPHLPLVTPHWFSWFFALCDRMNVVPMKLGENFISQSRKHRMAGSPLLPRAGSLQWNQSQVSESDAWISLFHHSWGCPRVGAPPLTFPLLKMQNLPSTVVMV